MGSLMAGWDSPVLGDDNKVRLMRNRSRTKEEVEAFWRQQHRKPAAEDNSGETVTSPLASPGAMEKNPFGSSQSSRSLPTSPLARGDKIDDDAGAGECPSKSRAWWTRSNSAFLNEPPQEAAAPGTAHNYKPQFHVVAGRIATGKA